MASMQNLIDSITTRHSSKSPLESRSERIWVDDIPIATASTTDARVTTPAIQKSTERSLATDELHASQSGGDQSFYYSASQTSTDSTYGSPVMADNISPTKAFPKVPQSPLKKSPSKRITSRYTSSEAPISPRFSVSAASYKRNAPSKQSFELPSLPTIRSHVSETALADAYSAQNVSRNRMGSNHVRFPSNASTRLEYIPDHSTCCTRPHHDVLERKIGALEAKMDNIVPALLALTQALDGLANKFDNGSVANKMNGMQQARGPEMTLQTPNGLTPYGLPTPANEDIFRLNSFVSDRESDRPMFGSVSDRGTIRGDGSRTHSRRGSKPARTIITEISEQDILAEIEGPRLDTVRTWGGRSRQQSCFEPDTESEVDDPDDADLQISPTRTITATRSSPPKVAFSPMKLQHKQSFNSGRACSHGGLSRTSPKKLAGRSAPPPPVKIPVYHTNCTAVAGEGPVSTGSNHCSPANQITSPYQSVSPTTATAGYMDRQIALRENEPLPPVPLTASLHRSQSHLSVKEITDSSVITTSPRHHLSLAPIKPLVIRSMTQPVQSSRATMPTSIDKMSLVPAPSSPPPARPAWYFFYGPLTDPTFLSELLHLENPPVLQPARIHTHSLRYFGPFPCAVPISSMRESAIGPHNENRDAVVGKAWYVSTAEMAEWLRRHEEEGFVEIACEIEFTKGSAVSAERRDASQVGGHEQLAGANEQRRSDDIVGALGVIGHMFEWRGSEDKLLAAPSI